MGEKVKIKDNVLFKTIMGLWAYFKKISEKEKIKKEKIKRAKNSSVKPKGFFARQFGVYTFWILFGFMFLTVIVTVFNGKSDEANADKPSVTVEKNYATSPEAIQFARNFTKEYFTWVVSDEGRNNRKTVMTKYLAEGLDEYAGLKFDGLQWNSKFLNAEIKKVEEKGKNLAHITFLVSFELSKGKEVKQASKYFVVPVAYDGKTFGVYELPKFTYVFEDTTLKQVVTQKLKTVNVQDSNKISEFLPTFFKSFAQDSKDKLNYILSDETVTDGLNNSMIFQKINSSDVYRKNEKSEKNIIDDKNENNDEFIVFTEVVFVEPQTKIPFTTNYQLTVKKEKDGRFIVTGIDNLKNKEVKTKNADEDETIIVEDEIQTIID